MNISCTAVDSRQGIIHLIILFGEVLLELRPITREIIRLLEEQSGYQVEVQTDPNLPVIASVRIARGNFPLHLVQYRPSAGEAPDYLICYQCSLALRLFQNLPEKRLDLADTAEGRQKVERLIASHPKLRLPPQRAAGLRDQLYDGLLLHLRSIPIGLRVSEWLAQHYPELTSAQEAGVRKELDQAQATLRPELKEMMPAKVYDATQVINAAYAIFWAEKWEKDVYVNPYRLYRYERGGRKLLDIWKDLPPGPAFDQELIDAWAAALELQGWYTWIPYQPPFETS